MQLEAIQRDLQAAQKISSCDVVKEGTSPVEVSPSSQQDPDDVADSSGIQSSSNNPPESKSNPLSEVQESADSDEAAGL